MKNEVIKNGRSFIVNDNFFSNVNTKNMIKAEILLMGVEEKLKITYRNGEEVWYSKTGHGNWGFPTVLK